MTVAPKILHASAITKEGRWMVSSIDMEGRWCVLGYVTGTHIIEKTQC